MIAQVVSPDGETMIQIDTEASTQRHPKTSVTG